MNADAPDYVAVTGGNLFTYCENCPTKNADYFGFCGEAVYGEGIETDKNLKGDQQKIAKFISDLITKICNWFSVSFDSYRGVPVVIFEKLAVSPFSFGVIFCGRAEYEIIDKTTLDHEWGHVVQFWTMGIQQYTIKVAIPSLLVYWYDRLTQKVSTELYYSLPWEYTADVFGGVTTHSYKKLSDVIAWIYYVCSLLGRISGL